MCGIIAVVRRPATRTAPDPAVVRDLMRAVQVGLSEDVSVDLPAALAAAAERLEEIDRLLHGPPGIRALLDTPRLAADVRATFDEIAVAVSDIERDLDETGVALDGSLEAINAGVVRLKDAHWAVARDRLRAASAVGDLTGDGPGAGAIEAFCSVHQALSALDRLEVRGRDSAGLSIFVHGHGLDLDAADVRLELEDRSDPLLRSGTVRCAAGSLVFFYKAAAEIGELGDNTAEMRAAIAADDLLRLALEADTAQATVLGHTRWASVGIISEPNAHPLDSLEVDRDAQPFVAAVLNGDVDNFADLSGSNELGIDAQITTDAKVIPTLVGRRLAAGDQISEAFRRTVASLEGSVAIGAVTAGDSSRLQLALRGSGQALYVGLAEDTFIVASEPYGLVEETATYLRMDGETPANADNPTASRGQIIDLSADRAGSVEGIARAAYDGTPLPVAEGDLTKAEITTRDIDRGTFPHFLLKEISEAPASFRKTLRGKLADGPEGLAVVLGDETLSPRMRERLGNGSIRSVLVIGQGTAHVAGMSLAEMLDETGDGSLRVDAILATELSGFQLRSDMSDTLVIAISQSGTTTDTNRTVDLARGRGADVLAVVNRRNSDLTDKADGVLYTSDGRDVEMSVASTKAFYSQVAAGFLLAVAILDEIGVDIADRQRLLEALRDLPDAMDVTLQRRPEAADAAQRLAAPRRYWAIVGSGPNVVAAREIRIKLSELCYKSIACDTTEDKKHIDLSAEPLIFVCAAGLQGSNADDVAKEVAIYRAHKAAPVVVASEGEERFSAALHVITVPAVHPRLAFVLSAMVGHLFGYEAALAIDAQAHPFREARGAIEQAAADGRASEKALASLEEVFDPVAQRFFDGLRAGDYNGHLEAGTAVRLASLFRYALGQITLDSYQVEYGKVGTPGVVLEDLTGGLTQAIEELTRPVDAIKHQAKTVTVGISRSDETLLHVPLVREVLDSGAPRDRLSYETLRTIADLDPVVEEVLGYTRYAVEGDVEDETATVVVVDQGGIARGLPSRTTRSPELRGTKNRVATERRVLVAKGRSDDRPIVIVPEVKDKQATGLTLLHLRFAPDPAPSAVRGALQGYRNRFSALRDAVTETEPTFREDLLGEIPVLDLLADSIYELADHWRAG